MNQKIEDLIGRAQEVKSISLARKEARKHLAGFPKNGCATFLSVLLIQSGIDVPVIVGAEELAHNLEHVRGWMRVKKGNQKAGDVGVTRDENDNGRADHIYVVARRLDHDAMQVADNQATFPHLRYVSGMGKTPTDYFLRGG